MSATRFATKCDAKDCGARSAEYSRHAVCRECLRDFCEAHVVPGSYQDDTGKALCLRCQAEGEDRSMNVDLLRKIQAHNTEHPEQLNLGRWLDGNQSCGTVACIAGHACVLANELPAEDWMASEIAGRLLGLDSDQRSMLFYTDDWPSVYVEAIMDHKAGTRQYAEAVNARIDHFIATGGAE